MNWGSAISATTNAGTWGVGVHTIGQGTLAASSNDAVTYAAYSPPSDAIDRLAAVSKVDVAE